MYYNLTLQKKKNVVAHLREYDVIVTTPHIKLPAPIVRNVKFHRLVVDESHLLEQSGAGTMSGRADALIEYQVRRPKLAPTAARRAHRSCTHLADQVRVASDGHALLDQSPSAQAPVERPGPKHRRAAFEAPQVERCCCRLSPRERGRRPRLI